jgi:hypothetical protein
MRRASHAFAIYLLLTLAATWPLARGLGRDVAWDLGDSLLNMWILAWDGEQMRHILGGDVSRISSFFDANIFYPAPLALAYSEHLIAQAVQVFPIYLVSLNPILCYNLLFLSTFALSGLGMYLLVRELTGNPAAAFVAGLLFAFAPYRLPQSSHLQVLSSQWMPFVFYGLIRYCRTGRIVPLAGAALALVAENLSCGYYLLYFAPFAGAFALWSIWLHGRWSNRRTWVELGIAGAAVVLLTVPFLLPYAALRGEFEASRSIAEVARFSADVYSYATAFPEQRIWGATLQAIPKPEGELFPGLVPLLLALAGLIGLTRPVLEGHKNLAPRWFVWLIGASAIVHGALALMLIVVRRVTYDTGLFTIRLGNVNQLLLRAAASALVLAIVSPAARARIAAFMRERGFFVLALGAAFWLSLGPLPQSLGRPLELAAPYRWLFDHMPGFDGLRVPARFSMIVVFLLSILGGFGAASLVRYRIGRYAVAAASLFFLVEATHVPFTVNGITPLRDYNTPEARVYRPARAPAVYEQMARQPASSVLVELPIGQPDYDLRAVYYSTRHWKRLVNGYSGFTPPQYGLLAAALTDIPRHAEVSLGALRASGATHAIVHEGAYLGTEGAQTSQILRNAGAVEVFRDGSDVLLSVTTK